MVNTASAASGRSGPGCTGDRLVPSRTWRPASGGPGGHVSRAWPCRRSPGPRGTDVGAPADPVGRLDALVPPAPEPENAVLADDARTVRWAGPLFALFALIMVPWTVYIGGSLPRRQLSPSYDRSRAGLDGMLRA